MLWWIALRACDAFYDRHGHYPGKHDQELAWEADANEVYGCMVRIAGGMGLAESDLVKEHLLDPVRGKDLARDTATTIPIRKKFFDAKALAPSKKEEEEEEGGDGDPPPRTDAARGGGPRRPRPRRRRASSFVGETLSGPSSSSSSSSS